MKDVSDSGGQQSSTSERCGTERRRLGYKSGTARENPHIVLGYDLRLDTAIPAAKSGQGDPDRLAFKKAPPRFILAMALAPGSPPLDPSDWTSSPSQSRSPRESAEWSPTADMPTNARPSAGISTGRARTWPWATSKNWKHPIPSTSAGTPPDRQSKRRIEAKQLGCWASAPLNRLACLI